MKSTSYQKFADRFFA